MRRNHLRRELYVALAISSLALFSCKKDNAPADANAPQEAVADTLTNAADTLNAEQPAETENITRYPTTEKQLEYMKKSGAWEKYDQGILPQMAIDAPEYCEKVLQAGDSRFIIVDKGKMKLFLYDRYGNIEKSYAIACAKNYGSRRQAWDSRTTEGCFKVDGVFESSNWRFTDQWGNTGNPGAYGPRFIRLNTPAIGIHGTGSASSIGRRVSHGCIRLTNSNILDLVKYVEVGMPVIISPGPRDMAVNLKENNVKLSVATEVGVPKFEPGTYQANPYPSGGGRAPVAAEEGAEELPEAGAETIIEVNEGAQSAQPAQPAESSAPAPAPEPAPTPAPPAEND